MANLAHCLDQRDSFSQQRIVIGIGVFQEFAATASPQNVLSKVSGDFFRPFIPEDDLAVAVDSKNHR
ncbi:MAG TPA: hypothetical protein VII25_12580 [Candidatus Acidoferrum sp.]